MVYEFDKKRIAPRGTFTYTYSAELEVECQGMGFEESQFQPEQPLAEPPKFERFDTRAHRLSAFAETGDPRELAKDDYTKEQAAEFGLVWNEEAQCCEFQDIENESSVAIESRFAHAKEEKTKTKNLDRPVMHIPSVRGGTRRVYQNPLHRHVVPQEQQRIDAEQIRIERKLDELVKLKTADDAVYTLLIDDVYQDTTRAYAWMHGNRTAEKLMSIAWENPEKFSQGLTRVLDQIGSGEMSIARLGLVMDHLESLSNALHTNNDTLGEAIWEYTEYQKDIPSSGVDEALLRVREDKKILEKLRNTLKEKLILTKNTVQSELVALRIGSMLEHIDQPTLFAYEDRSPFKDDEGEYVVFRKGGLFTHRPEDADKVEGYCQKIQELRETLISLEEEGRGSDTPSFEQHSEVKDVLSIQNELWHLEQRAVALCTESVASEQVMLTRFDQELTGSNSVDWDDYVFLMSPEMRGYVAKRFDISLLDLPRRERYYFLRDLKHASREYLEYVKTFSSRFGLDALRTSLVSEYDSRLIDKVHTFAELTEPEVVMQIFANYTKLLDASNKFASEMQMHDSDIASEGFSQQLEEAFVRRTADLFFAAERISTYDPMLEETIEDLRLAFAGVSLHTEILSDLVDQKIYDVTFTNGNLENGNLSLAITHKTSGDRYTLKVFIRPESSYKAQARISFELILDQLPEVHPLRQAFTHTTRYKREKKSKKDRTEVTESSIRFSLDLDSHYGEPHISFDMGRDSRDSETTTRTGDVLGNILSKVAPEGHHLFASFSPELSRPDTFAMIADQFRTYVRQAAIPRS